MAAPIALATAFRRRDGQKQILRILTPQVYTGDFRFVAGDSGS
jgi:hypothetical protein